MSLSPSVPLSLKKLSTVAACSRSSSDSGPDRYGTFGLCCSCTSRIQDCIEEGWDNLLIALALAYMAWWQQHSSSTHSVSSTGH